MNYPCAWMHDLLGRDGEAVPFYEKVIQAGLDGDDLKSALKVGEHAKAVELLLTRLVNTSRDERALRFYSDRLDQVW